MTYTFVGDMVAVKEKERAFTATNELVQSDSEINRMVAMGLCISSLFVDAISFSQLGTLVVY